MNIQFDIIGQGYAMFCDTVTGENYGKRKVRQLVPWIRTNQQYPKYEAER